MCYYRLELINLVTSRSIGYLRTHTHPRADPHTHPQTPHAPLGPPLTGIYATIRHGTATTDRHDAGTISEQAVQHEVRAHEGARATDARTGRP